MTDNSKQFDDWVREIKNIATKERKQNEDHDGFKVRWKKIQPPSPDKKTVIGDFIFTFVYPVNPLMELLGIKGTLLSILPFFLALLLFVRFGDPMYINRSVPGFIVFTIFFLLTSINKNLIIFLFLISIMTVYILGYYQLFRKNKNK